VSVGQYQVSVTPPAVQTEQLSPEEAMTRVQENPDAFTADAQATIPEKYKSFSDSGVTFEVKEGSNDFVLDMKS
ncbi:MAG: hypothetical protein KY475_11615, partial [Planctomycetes bacterium]|nr:hypothetical protein [Planctomycetota bacterium]